MLEQIPGEAGFFTCVNIRGGSIPLGVLEKV